VLIVCDAVGDDSDKSSEPRLALLNRPPAEVLAIELELVESAQHDSIIAQPIAQCVKIRKPEPSMTIASPSITHEWRPRLSTAAVILGKRAVIGPMAGEEAHALGITPGEYAAVDWLGDARYAPWSDLTAGNPRHASAASSSRSSSSGLGAASQCWAAINEKNSLAI
jgi:hypothetical protein